MAFVAPRPGSHDMRHVSVYVSGGYVVTYAGVKRRVPVEVIDLLRTSKRDLCALTGCVVLRLLNVLCVATPAGCVNVPVLKITAASLLALQRALTCAGTLRMKRVFTLGDARSFFGPTSKIPPSGSMLNFDADVKNTSVRHQYENRLRRGVNEA